jgi:hypothetical protein
VNAIQTKSSTVRTLFAVVLGCASLAVNACGSDDPPSGTSDGLCGGITGKVCPEGQFCHHEGGTCGQGDALGACQPIPTVCAQECVQVCGCDAKSYCNACIAHMAGIDDAPSMTCDDTPPL